MPQQPHMTCRLSEISSFLTKVLLLIMMFPVFSSSIAELVHFPIPSSFSIVRSTYVIGYFLTSGENCEIQPDWWIHDGGFNVVRLRHDKQKMILSCRASQELSNKLLNSFDGDGTTFL